MATVLSQRSGSGSLMQNDQQTLEGDDRNQGLCDDYVPARRDVAYLATLNWCRWGYEVVNLPEVSSAWSRALDFACELDQQTVIV